MPRVSIFIVTYRNPDDLKSNIASILASGADVRINVINNHSEFFLDPEHSRAVTVWHNRLRPDFSTGHLARNWNQALLHGFRDLNNPANDIVITVQDDVLFKRDWFSHLMDLHRRFSFVSLGAGDAFCSYMPEAVKKVGLWDERFCNIGCQEGDYFLRATIYNSAGSSINDLAHGRQHNALDGNVFTYLPEHPDDEAQRADSLLIATPQWNVDRKNAHIASMKSYALSQAVFLHKWGIPDAPWTAEHLALKQSLAPSYIMYPYFERDVEGLREKNYVVAEPASVKRWEEFSAGLDRTRPGYV